jgi:hypothetical protein
VLVISARLITFREEDASFSGLNMENIETALYLSGEVWVAPINYQAGCWKWCGLLQSLVTIPVAKTAGTENLDVRQSGEAFLDCFRVTFVVCNEEKAIRP